MRKQVIRLGIRSLGKLYMNNNTMNDKMNEITPLLERVNKIFSEAGLLEIAVVNPNDCYGQKINARYFDQSTFTQLVENIKEEGALESTPLVYRHAKQDAKYMIISGHHRVDGAKQAGLGSILVLIAKVNPDDKDSIVSKQLAHNALVGKDDKMILAELFNSITSTIKKIQTGLQDEISKINTTSLNFTISTFEQFTITGVPSDVKLYDQTIQDIEKKLAVKSDSTLILVDKDVFPDFEKHIRKVKKVKNIKNNATAFFEMVRLARKGLEIEAKAKSETTKR